MPSSSRLIVPSSITLPCASHHGVYSTCPTAHFMTLRVTIRSSRRAASRPPIRYLWSGDTSISAAALRIAAYSRSGCGSYALATWCPAQRRHV